MFRKMIILAIIVLATIIALPEKAEAAYPNGASVGAALTGGFPFSGLVLTGKFTSVPIVFGAAITGANFDFGDGGANFFGINLTADWWGFTLPLGQAGDAAVTIYLGPGGTLDLSFGGASNGYFYADLGIRMPVGFSFLIKRSWEIFLEPSIGLNVIGVAVYDGKASMRILGSGLDSFSFGLNSIRFGGQFGFRYWF